MELVQTEIYKKERITQELQKSLSTKNRIDMQNEDNISLASTFSWKGNDCQDGPLKIELKIKENWLNDAMIFAKNGMNESAATFIKQNNTLQMNCPIKIQNITS